jgi:hypothetical protein
MCYCQLSTKVVNIILTSIPPPVERVGWWLETSACRRTVDVVWGEVRYRSSDERGYQQHVPSSHFGRPTAFYPLPYPVQYCPFPTQTGTRIFEEVPLRGARLPVAHSRCSGVLPHTTRCLCPPTTPPGRFGHQGPLFWFSSCMGFGVL